MLKTGKHTVTAITRHDSKSALPNGVEVKKVDYESQSSLTEALRGQDALIITMSVFAASDQQSKLFRAAVDAKVPWVLPNEWGADTTNTRLVNDVPGFEKAPKAREELDQLEELSYIAVTTGSWYEWSLSIGAAYGFDFANRTVTLFDEGKTKITTSTWPQVGRAVAALLSLPIKPVDHAEDRCLERFKNSQVYVSSFSVSQKEMLDSVLRETQTSIGDWKVVKEPSHERYANGMKAMQGGDAMGFVRLMYARIFFPDDSDNIEETRGTINELLGLPKENFDEATKAAIERAKENATGYL